MYFNFPKFFLPQHLQETNTEVKPTVVFLYRSAANKLGRNNKMCSRTNNYLRTRQQIVHIKVYSAIELILDTFWTKFTALVQGLHVSRRRMSKQLTLGFGTQTSEWWGVVLCSGVYLFPFVCLLCVMAVRYYSSLQTQYGLVRVRKQLCQFIV